MAGYKEGNIININDSKYDVHFDDGTEIKNIKKENLISNTSVLMIGSRVKICVYGKPWVKHYKYHYGLYSPTSDKSKIRMQVNMIDLMVLYMAEYKSIKSMAVFCNKHKLNVPHGWWLWEYEDIFSQEDRQGLWEGPTEECDLIPLYRYQLVKKRIHIELSLIHI